MAVGGRLGGLDPAVARRLAAADQAGPLQAGERAADLGVVLLEEFGQFENADRPAQVDVDQEADQFRIDCDPGPVQNERAEAGAGGALEYRQPDVVVVVAGGCGFMGGGVGAGGAGVIGGAAGLVGGHSVHYARISCL